MYVAKMALLSCSGNVIFGFHHDTLRGRCSTQHQFIIINAHEYIISAQQTSTSTLLLTISRKQNGQLTKSNSSSYERRLMFQRSWVRIPTTYTGWTFFLIDLL